MTRRIRSYAIAVAALVFASGVVLLWTSHEHSAVPRAAVRASAAEAASEQAITKALQDSGVAGLDVRRAGEIVILRGTATAENAAKALEIVRSFGVTRVANLVSQPTASDDDLIRRSAERRLTSNRALDGCNLRVSCENGIVSVTGTVQHEMQKDAARNLLRTLPGAKELRFDLSL